MSTTNFTWGLGRRKTATARVRVTPGAGGFLVNGRDMKEFFCTVDAQNTAIEPLKATLTEGQYRCHLRRPAGARCPSGGPSRWRCAALPCRHAAAGGPNPLGSC